MRWPGLLLLSVLAVLGALPRAAHAALTTSPSLIVVTDPVDGATATTVNGTLTGTSPHNVRVDLRVEASCTGAFTIGDMTDIRLDQGPQPISIGFTASAAGTIDCNVEVLTRTATPSVIGTFPIRGVGTVGDLSAPAGPISFGSVRVNGIVGTTTLTASQQVTLQNAGTSPLIIEDILLSGTHASNFTLTPMPVLPQQIAAGGQLQLTIVFDPSAAGTRTASLDVSTNDPTGGDPSIALTGTGTTATLAVSDAAFGTVVVGATGTQVINITNTASPNPGTLRVTSANLVQTGTWFSFAAANGCTTTSTTCTPTAATAPTTVTVRCIPPVGAMGTQNATVVFETDADTATDNVSNLSCTAGRPDAAVDFTTLAFNNVVVGTTPSPTLTVTLENVGTTNLTYGLTRFGTHQAQFTFTSACVSSCTLAPGDSRTIDVTFTPIGTGPRSATLRITSNDPDNPTLDVALSGTGIAGIASVDPVNLAFGAVQVGQQSAPQTVTLMNTGLAPLSIASASVTTGAADYVIPTGITGAQTVAAGASVSWTIRCQPTAQGVRNGTFRIASNSGGSATNSDVALTCTGERGALAIAATSHNFGNVAAGTTASQTFTLTNTGNVAVNDISATLSDATAGYEITSPTFPIPTLTAGQSVVVTVQFAPQDGDDGGAVTVNFAGTWGAGAGVPTNTTLTLDGNGLGVGFDVDPATVAFGDVRFDAFLDRTFCITNSGESPLNITALSIAPAVGTQSGEFTVVSRQRRASCTGAATPDVALPQTLAVGQLLVVTVRADPANRAGAMAATLTVTSNLAQNPTRAVALTATATTALLTTDPASLVLDFGSVDLQAGPQARDVVITNSGNATLNLGAFTRTANARFTLTLPGASTLAPGATLTVPITYTPNTEHAPGQGDSFTLTHTIGGVVGAPASQTITVRGRGIDRRLALAPVPTFPDTFRNPGAAAPVRPIIVTNTGEATLRITAVMVSNADVWQVDTSPVDIAGGASHEFDVTFVPRVAGAAPQGVLVFSSDDDQRPMATVLLDGNGLDRSVVMTDPVIDLGLTGIGTPVSLPAAIKVTSMDGANTFTVRAIELEDDSAFALDGPTADLALAPSGTLEVGVTFTPTDEGEFETRALLYLDEDPLPQAQVTLRGRAVFVEATGGGGCAAAGDGAGGAGALALVLAGVLAARRRRAPRVAVVAGALAAVAAPGAAAAQGADLDLSLFEPTPSTVGTTFQLQPGGVGASGSLATMAMVSYATNPLVLRLGDTEHLTVSQRSTLDLGVAYAFLGRFEAGLRMPLYSQAGDGEVVNIGSPDGTARGDLTAHLRAQLVRSRGANDLALALGGQLTLPTASDAQFAGVDGPSGRVLALLSLTPAALRSRLTLTANAGAVLRSTARLSNVAQGSGAVWGAGASFRVVDSVWAVGEVFGEVLPGARQDAPMASAAALTTAEFLVGLAVRPARAVTLGLAGGRGLVAGIGTPDLRGVFALTITPSAPALAPIYPPPPPPPDTDDDGDGLRNSVDGCDDDAEDMDQFEDADGCPDKDNDADGVIDAADSCPLEAEDRDGFEDDNGCPDLDNDADGVPDTLDKCPAVVEDKDGAQDADGCPEKDNDGDGIDDDADKCPNEAEAINGNQDDDGCPDRGDSLVILTPGALELLEPVAFTGTKLSPKSDNVLGQIAATLRANPEIARFKIVAHVNPTGAPARDLDISTRRAQAVRDWLVQWGIAAARVSAQGLGGKKPLVPATQRGAANINERLELIILERN